MRIGIGLICLRIRTGGKAVVNTMEINILQQKNSFLIRGIAILSFFQRQGFLRKTGTRIILTASLM